jgi:hypothetical protein
MAGMQDSTPRKRSFGGKFGSKKTLWLTIVVGASLIAVGAVYFLPQYL